MNKAVTRPTSLKVDCDFFNKFEYGFVLDLQKIRKDFLDIQKSESITFYTGNGKIGKMLNSRNIKKFREITKGFESQIDICKKKSTNRKITVTGENAYSIYLVVKGLLG